MRAILVFLFMSAVSGLGYHFGKLEGDAQASKVREEIATARVKAAEASRVHALEMTRLQSDSLALLQYSIDENSKKYNIQYEKLKKANTVYENRTVEIAAAKINASKLISDVNDGGMWVDINPESCSTGSSNSYSSGDAKSPETAFSLRRTGPSRCRLSNEAAEFYVALSSEADVVVEKLNRCISEIRAVNAIDDK